MGKALYSIKKQEYPKESVEVLVIDGGSSDSTIDIAKSYNAKIINNSKTELIYAKHIGFLKARGKYLIFLDSDEILDNSKSLELKVKVYGMDKSVKAVTHSGYKTSKDSHVINYYINEFGEPFTLFVYRESKDDLHLIPRYKNKYEIIKENNNGIVFRFSGKKLPYIELWSGGCSIDLEYSRETFPEIKNNPSLIALLFYLLIGRGKYLGVTKNDPTIHQSAENLGSYLRKISSRVRNNVFKTSMGLAGFSGREKYENFWIRFKKYLFLPYGLTVIPPLIDGLYLIGSRRRSVYLFHLPLTLYTCLLIIYFYIFKIFGIEMKFKTYGK